MRKGERFVVIDMKVMSMANMYKLEQSRWQHPTLQTGKECSQRH